ncbi:class I adenylate-forming enzyme family protein, partial [Pseudonocardia pini]|uniref:class I adenylate-forming enzyme family protein n=1 Tax=Pseudonocardia pini TaxID=2758030 RepID=UPI0015F10F2A
SDAVPLTLFGAALAGKPYVPLNYRLTDAQLGAIVRRMAPATLVVGEGVAERIGAVEGITLLETKELLRVAEDPGAPLLDVPAGDPDDIAVLLFTSGTTGEPKAAVLRHRNLTAYILSTVEFGGSAEHDAALVSVPPYHIAGVSAVLSNTYSGRRVLRMAAFDPAAWVELARAESVSHAMVVPTMLDRILDVVERDGAGLPALRSLSYGGGPMPRAVIERALRLLPGVGFVNAYGLTETSSTIAVLGPDDHREAFDATDPAVRARLGSVGRPLPAVEVSVRDAEGGVLPPGERGEIWVRGEQVSGEYLSHSGTNDEGWFTTRDAGMLDADGYLHVFGRLDDVIVRGGENLSPGEIETVLLEHPAVAEAAVFGVPDREWGEAVAAAVVLADGASATVAELQAFVRERLRSTRTPEHIDLRDELPYSETGKLLRRTLRA